jgi:GxxExxY protein
MTDNEIMGLCDRVREAAFAAHRFLRHGHAEKIYENALANRIKRAGFRFAQQYPLAVFDEDGSLLGDFFADLVVEEELIVELKAVRFLAEEHIAQVLGYLRAAQKRHALLINFGSPRIQIKKFIMRGSAEADLSPASF